MCLLSSSVGSLVGGWNRLESHCFSCWRGPLTSLVVIPGALPLVPFHLGTTSPRWSSSTLALVRVRAR